MVWIDQNLSGVIVKAAHVQQLRTALKEIFDAATLIRPSFSDDPLPQQATIKALHFTELRAAVLALEATQ